MGDPFKTLRDPKIKWLCPQEEGDSQEFDSEQRRQVENFLGCAAKKASDRAIEILFRGETRVRLAERLCKRPATLIEVATALFYFGEKGKYFWNAHVRRSQEEVGRQWATLVQSLDDVSANSFEGPLRELTEILEVKVEAAISFRKGNQALCEEVRSEEGRRELVERFEALRDDDKRWVRDLFIYIVHTFSRKEHKNYTPFVSTTPNLRRAKQFASTGADKSDGRCVIYIFAPKTVTQRAFRSTELKNYSARLETLGFPPVNQLFFEEGEVALFGGIYPHYMFAIQDLKSKEAYWNPALFRTESHPISKVLERGFAIDQWDFEGRLATTGYTGGVEHYGDGEREISARGK